MGGHLVIALDYSHWRDPSRPQVMRTIVELILQMALETRGEELPGDDPSASTERRNTANDLGPQQQQQEPDATGASVVPSSSNWCARRECRRSKVLRKPAPCAVNW